MATQKKSQAAPSRTDSPVNLLLTGVICLAVGLGIGYYFGRQFAEVSVPAQSVPSQQMPQSGPAAPLQDPAAFMQQEAALKAMLTVNPKDLNSLVQLGNLYYDSARYQQAIEYYGKAVQIDPKNPNVQTDLGTSYWNINQADPAIAAFEKSLAVDPGHAQTLYNLGVVYLHGKNDVERAKKAWQTLLAKNPGYPDRAKVEQQLAALASPQSAAPAAPAANQPGSQGVEDLLERMKSRKQ
jgi:cytochrome c-type biogenesis protein CcmH/NrfG